MGAFPLWRVLCAAGSVMTVSAVAAAQEIAWTNPAGGLFSHGANWQGSAPPTETQTALFDLPAAYTVTFDTDATVGGLRFRRGEAIFNLPARRCTLGNSDAVAASIAIGDAAGENAAAVLSSGSVLLRTNAEVRIGEGAGGTGRLEVRGTESQLAMGGAMFLGAGGRLLVSQGGLVSDTLPGAGNIGRIEMTAGASVESIGAGSFLNIRGLLGTGEVRVLGGARINADIWNLTGTSMAIADGSGSALTWENGFSTTGSLLVSGGASAVEMQPSIVSVGVLTVEGAGSVFAAADFSGQAVVGSGGEATGSFTGSVTARDPGTRLTLRGLTGIGSVSLGARATVSALDGSSLTVRDSGSMLDGTSVNIGRNANSAVRIENGASMQVSNELVVWGGSRLELLSGATATAGQVFLAAINGGEAGSLYIAPGSQLSAERIDLGILGTGDDVSWHAVVDGRVNVVDRIDIAQTGQLSGGGVIGGSIVNSGLVTPGNSAGRLSVHGSFTQLATGLLEMEILGVVEGSGYDVLDVAGSVTLDGRLDVIIGADVVITEGDSFALIRAGSVSGAFSHFDLPNLPSGLSMHMQYHAGGVTLVVVPAPGAVGVLLGGLLIAGRRRRA